jgi:hypothetical protein
VAHQRLKEINSWRRHANSRPFWGKDKLMADQDLSDEELLVAAVIHTQRGGFVAFC